jgi:hypothetical protein
MFGFQQLRDKIQCTTSLLNFSISQCEISATATNIKEFNKVLDDAEMLLKEMRNHINELMFLSKLQRLSVGSKLVNSNIRNSWFLMRNETIVETDFAIEQHIIDALKAKYKFIPTDSNNHFIMYELINKTI